MPGTKLRGREILQLFYTEVDRAVSVKGVQDKLDGASIFQCKCGKTRAQNLKHGYTNLVQHVVVKHSDWVEAALREAVPCPVPASITRDERRARKEKGKSESEKKNESKREDMTESKTTIPNARDEEPTPPSTIVVTSTTSEPVQVLKRSDYLSWDDYFMSVAFLSAMRSKGCIVNPDRKIVGIGYNGFPNGCGDDDLPWARESETNSLLETKYPVRKRVLLSYRISLVGVV
ncbi:hypothetical protein PsorP6_000654 [Peronosclerospora sorghi]|uniref:Uncharacterized protein n=1 Tax=Peronosclerospora sorghi TaxID=230839 RepID=A0ACC0WS29_9STRA|nr:hypothetical protein PsorP6_000654 [Peronosclerospora sorghi]